MKKIHVKPRPLTKHERALYPKLECARVRRPAVEGGDLLPAKGVEVIESIFWLRRIKGGDVILSTEPAKSPKRAAVKE